MKKLVLLLLTSSAALAQTSPLAELIALARHGPAAPGLKDGIAKTLSARGGNAVWGQDYLFVSDSPAPVTISLDNQPAVPMAQVAGSSLWILLIKMRTGVGGKDFPSYPDPPAPVTLPLDNHPAVPMAQVAGSSLWMLLIKIRTGVTHSFQYYAAGKPLRSEERRGGE